jgi:hypothetical protein
MVALAEGQLGVRSAPRLIKFWKGLTSYIFAGVGCAADAVIEWTVLPAERPGGRVLASPELLA